MMSIFWACSPSHHKNFSIHEAANGSLMPLFKNQGCMFHPTPKIHIHPRFLLVIDDVIESPFQKILCLYTLGEPRSELLREIVLNVIGGRWQMCACVNIACGYDWTCNLTLKYLESWCLRPVCGLMSEGALTHAILVYVLHYEGCHYVWFKCTWPIKKRAHILLHNTHPRFACLQSTRPHYYNETRVEFGRYKII